MLFLVCDLNGVNMKMLLPINLIFACIIATGESISHNWRHSNPSYPSSNSKRWESNRSRSHNGRIRGHNPYYRYKTTNSRTISKNIETAQTSKYNLSSMVFSN